jgi:hypothetical protein
VTSDQREEFVAMSARTFGVDDPETVEEFRNGTGASNAYPRVGPVVISEIMYHPPELGTNDNTRDEFIELQNITTAPVPLFEGTNGWHLRDAVDFDFPPGTTIQPGDYLLVVSFDPVNNPAALAAFRARYNLSASTSIVGPWNGKLANDSDDLELRRPDVPNLDNVPYILVEHVHYFDVAPWPAQADGTGFSLQRVAVDAFANDPANWIADAPSPGPAASGGDTDGDGLPDYWENLYGFDPRNPNDANLDSDGDGLTNLQEFQLGTDPRDPASGLNLRIAIGPGGVGAVLSFGAAAGMEYAVEGAADFTSSWQLVQSFAAVSTNRLIQLPVATGGLQRFYRLRLGSAPPPVVLRFNSVQSMPGNQVALSFNVPANQNCILQFAPNLPGASWTTINTYSSVGTNRVIQVVTPASGERGFYQLRSP